MGRLQRCAIRSGTKNFAICATRVGRFPRHCERSEAIQLLCPKGRIASLQVLPCANASRLSQAMTEAAETTPPARPCASCRHKNGKTAPAHRGSEALQPDVSQVRP